MIHSSERFNFPLSLRMYWFISWKCLSGETCRGHSLLSTFSEWAQGRQLSGWWGGGQCYIHLLNHIPLLFSDGCLLSMPWIRHCCTFHSQPRGGSRGLDTEPPMHTAGCVMQNRFDFTPLTTYIIFLSSHYKGLSNCQVGPRPGALTGSVPKCCQCQLISSLCPLTQMHVGQ